MCRLEARHWNRRALRLLMTMLMMRYSLGDCRESPAEEEILC
jgi:hypothetical protein